MEVLIWLTKPLWLLLVKIKPVDLFRPMVCHFKWLSTLMEQRQVSWDSTWFTIKFLVLLESLDLTNGLPMLQCWKIPQALIVWWFSSTRYDKLYFKIYFCDMTIKQSSNQLSWLWTLFCNIFCEMTIKQASNQSSWLWTLFCFRSKCANSYRYIFRISWVLTKIQRSRFLIGADRSILTIFTNRLLILFLFHREQICSER